MVVALVAAWLVVASSIAMPSRSLSTPFPLHRGASRCRALLASQGVPQVVLLLVVVVASAVVAAVVAVLRVARGRCTK